MFGNPLRAGRDSGPPRRAAHEVARIQGGGLVQVIVTSLSPIAFEVFLNEKAIPQLDVESLFVSIEAPSGEFDTGALSATLSHYVRTVTGERVLQQTALFPCTLEIIALGRRIAVTCPDPTTVDGTWIELGLKPDGTGNEVTGARSFQVLLSSSILDAKLTWDDGETEALLPQTIAP